LDSRLSQFENETKRFPLELTFPLVAGDRRADDLALVALGVLHLAGREGLSGGGAGTAGRWLEAGCKGCGMGELSGIGVGGAGEGAGDGTGSGLRVVSGRNEDLWWFLAAAGATDAAAWKRKRDFGWKSGGGGWDVREAWRVGWDTGTAASCCSSGCWSKVVRVERHTGTHIRIVEVTQPGGDRGRIEWVARIQGTRSGAPRIL